MDVPFSAISIESRGCMVRMLWRPWLTYIHGSNAKCAHFLSLFVVMMSNKCLATASKLPLEANFSHKFSICQGVKKIFSEHSNVEYLERPSSKRINKEFWTTLDLCKISSFSAISAQLVAKSFQKPATKICWYPLFSQTCLSSKNVETLGQNT